MILILKDAVGGKDEDSKKIYVKVVSLVNLEVLFEVSDVLFQGELNGKDDAIVWIWLVHGIVLEKTLNVIKLYPKNEKV